MKRFMSFWFSAILLISGAIILSRCGGTPGKDMDTPTAGRIKVGTDDSYKLLLDAETYTFQSLYKYASIDMVLGAEADIIDLFMKDSVPMMIVNRKLTKEEESFLNSRQIIPKTTKIAYDALALIVNRENPDTNLYYDDISALFNGKISTWKSINPKKSDKDSVKVVFDNYKSGNPRYFKEKFNLTRLPSCCFAVASNADVIDFVEKNKNALGIISVNWISDKADSISHGFLTRIRVARISGPGHHEAGSSFYSPHPGYIAQGDYPFTREVYSINRQTYSGLAYGFSSFIAGEKGQLIVLHSGMVPASMPVRLVEVRH